MKKQKGQCNLNACPYESETKFTDWTPWSKCSHTCGPGTMQRNRRCKTVSNLKDKTFEENKCPSKMKEFKRKRDNNLYRKTKECTVEPCSEPAWGEWEEWGKCSVTCGLGGRTRKRKCLDIMSGKILDLSECSQYGKKEHLHNDRCTVKDNCPVDGGISEWSLWSDCSISCGDGGIQRRYRGCTDPIPQFGGKDCGEFKREEKQNCNSKDECPVNCVWSHWGEWSKCDKTCYKATFDKKGRLNRSKKLDTLGQQMRKRHKAQEAKNGGIECDEGQNSDIKTCSQTKKPCPVDCVWDAWGSWDNSMCEECYDEGNYPNVQHFLELEMERKRKVETESVGTGTCLDHKEKPAKKIKQRKGDTETRKCTDEAKPLCSEGLVAKWTNWGEWSDCKGECGKQGFRRQKRSCVLYPDGEGDEETRIVKCKELLEESNASGAPNDEQKTDCPNICAEIGGIWGEWGTCSNSCGKGFQVRPWRCNGAGKEEIDHAVAADVCGVHQRGKKKGKPMLRRKEKRECDLGECGSRYIPDDEY